MYGLPDRASSAVAVMADRRLQTVVCNSHGQFLPRDALVHAQRGIEIACCPSVCLSVGDVGGSGSHRLDILETNCTVN